MKVHGSDPLAGLKDLMIRAKEAGPADASESARAGRAAGTDGRDSVQLSDTAQEIQRLRDGIADIPDVRGHLVQQLRDEIASGQYHVDGTRVAEALMHEELLLAGSEDDGFSDI